MNILYVEDNEDLRVSIQDLIENHNRKVFSCSSAEEAIHLDKNKKFDVVMTDISLPGMSGVEFAKLLLKGNPERNVILCSGYELGNYPKDWGRNVHTLLKPFEIEDLEAILENIEKHSLIRENI